MKNIKKLLHEQAPQILPDDRIKENICRELGVFDQPREQLAYAHGNVSTPSAKKIWIPVAAFLAALALLLGILIPVLAHKDPGSVPSLPGTGLGKFSGIESTQDFYVYGAASVGSLLCANTADASDSQTAFASPQADADPLPLADALSFDTPQPASLLRYRYGSPDSSPSAQGEEAIVHTVNGYMALVEGLLGEGNIEHTDALPPAESDPYADRYDLKMTIFYTDLLGVKVHYQLYYNEILTDSKQDEDETEENFSIDGVLIVEGKSYPVVGERQSESETDESENELQFTAFLNEEKTSYIRMQQEFESETDDGEQESEQEFEYTYYLNGEWQTRTCVKYELENQELELKLTVEERDKEKDELVFCREHSDAALLVRGKIQGQDVRFTIRIIQENGKNQYRYEFSNGNSWNQDRWDDDNDDDDDDDD